VGSYHNPPNMPGLAHFLEHMLFRGSLKYPEVELFVDLIKKNNGIFNAYTASEETNYFF
jgi:secreted Zn-dependent insulinase-like peptidase